MPILVDKENPTIKIKDENGNEKEIQNVYIQYSIPEKYKKLCTLEFLTEFRNQLFRMDKWFSLEVFADEGIPMNTSTYGWVTALYKACSLTNNEELYNYWRTLPWYDSDIFDSIIAEMLIENNLILDNISTYALKYNIVNNIEDIIDCNKCYNAYTKDDVEYMSKDDEDYDIFADDDYIPHICKKCSSDKNVKTINEKINESKDQTEFISKELNIPLNNLCYCTKCKKVYTYNMGLLKNNKFICYYCDDLSKNPKYENATDYYRQVCNEMDEYNKRKE